MTVFFHYISGLKWCEKVQNKNLSDPLEIIGIVAQKPIKFFVFQNSQLRGNVMILQKPLVPNKLVCQQNLSWSIFFKFTYVCVYTLKINRGDCRYCSYNRNEMASFSKLVRFFNHLCHQNSISPVKVKFQGHAVLSDFF